MGGPDYLYCYNYRITKMYQNSGNILMISNAEHRLNMFRSEFAGRYNVFIASSIREGYQVLSDYDVHVALIDQKMPQMTGLQFCESLSHSFPEIIKMVLTDSKDTASLDRAIKKDLIYRYVRLPFDNSDLRMILDGALKLNEAEFHNRKLSKQIEKFKGEQENILRLFKKYVPPEVVSQALKSNDDQLMTPGEFRVVSVLFADIRGFTKFASHLRPSQVVDFLNDYWTEISDCVKQNKGSVNKYMGDGLLAIFGAPVSYIDNHENAVSAALDMVDRLDVINKKYADLLGTEIKVGIGINSGEVVVGNIGTDNYMEYTVIGDTVNIASKMEAISKKSPNSIIISERTRELVHHAFKITKPRETTIENKDEVISYCEVIGRKSDNVYNIYPHQGNI